MLIDRRVCVVALAALVTVALGGGCSSNKKDAAADVTVTRCDTDPSGGQPTAEGNIRNRTSKDSAYAFRVTFTDASGNKVSDGAASVAKVDAGATATWHATGATGATGPLKCKATNVVRTAVP